MFCVQSRRSLKKFSLTAIRCFFSFPLEKPVSEKLKLDVFYAVIIQNYFHVFQSTMLEGMFQISMPDSNTFKTSPGCGFYPIFEIEAAFFITDTWEYSGSCSL